MALIKSYYKILRVLPDPDYFYVQNEYSGSNTFTLTKTGTPATTDLEYSKDKSTWTQFDLTQDTNTVTLNSGEKLYIRSSTGFSGSSNYLKMNCSQNYSVGGHIASLLDYQNIDSITAIPNSGFFNIFYESSTLISAENLDFSGITSVGNRGMSSAFYNCSALTTGPDLSSITSIDIYGMSTMFNGCSALTTGPDLSSVTSVGERGMMAMFQNCSALITGPDLSSLTSIVSNGLFSCFSNCTALTTAPDLSSLTNVGTNGMYSCFGDCTALTTGPDLSSLRYVNSSGMYCCFSGCSSLNLVTAPNVSSWNTSNFNYWLSGVAATGVVRKPSGLTIPTGTNGVPTGWTTVDY